jgi:hypothetical protein
MKTLNLPAYPFRLSELNGKSYIYDPLRRKDVTLTPEEWVRQHFVRFLISDRAYPPERIANEVCINLNTTSKRCDTIVYDDFLTPLVIIEYKAPEVAVTSEVFDQITRYNSALRVPYLMVSNGIKHYCCQMDYQTIICRFLDDIPSYPEILHSV